MDIKDNVLIAKWRTPFGIPPFNEIKPEDFLPAIRKCITLAKEKIDEIISNKEAPGFSNTIEALENTGKELNLVSATLFNLNSAETNKNIQEATQEASQLLTRFSNDITLNEDLFIKVKSVYESFPRELLTTEQRILLDDKYRSFRNGGAELKPDERARFREVSEELSGLAVKFEENLLAETNGFELHITGEEDLEGLPDSLIELGSEEAVSRKKDGWVFTLHFPSYIPFMQYSEKRNLRKKMLLAYSSRCFRNNENSNLDIVKKIVNLRLELARLLGFSTYADFILEDRMANSKEKVDSFLSELFSAAHQYALNDYESIREFASKIGHKGEIERWDWPYFAEKLKKERYSIDDETLKPYFKLENAEKAIFDLAGTLYGLTFRRISKTPSYNPETRTFEVIDKQDRHVAILITDYHPRKGKSGGAWMTAFREQHIANDNNIRPIVSIVMNFSRPTSKMPSLLTHNELTTLLHEFGHALHGILSKCSYESLSGTNVKRDFVELPSQIMENWAYEKEWLDKWAVHYESGESIPPVLIEKIRASHIYNEGYACNRQLGFGFLDMAWHSISKPYTGDIDSFEREVTAETELFNPVPGTNQSCAFGHLFSGGYAAGYYGYKWAEVLDADAFSIFKERGIFDRDTANSFRQNILEKGGSDNPMELFKKFRGAEPSINALLKRSGFMEK